MKAQHIDKLLPSGVVLQRLVKKLDFHAQLTLRLQPVIFELTQIQVCVINLDEKRCLICSTDSQSAANHLTYLKSYVLRHLRAQPELSDIFNHPDRAITALRFRYMPSPVAHDTHLAKQPEYTKQKPTEFFKPNEENRNAMISAVQSIKNERLKQAMLRLAAAS